MIPDVRCNHRTDWWNDWQKEEKCGLTLSLPGTVVWGRDALSALSPGPLREPRRLNVGGNGAVFTNNG